MKPRHEKTLQINRLLDEHRRLLLPFVAARTRMPLADLAKRFTAIRTIPIPDVNGTVRSSDNGRTFVVEIYSGLLSFISKVVNAFAARTISHQGHAVIASSVFDEQRSIRLIEKLLDAFWSGKVDQMPGFEFLHLDDIQQRVGEDLLTSSVEFVVAHELGHIVLDVAREEVSPSAWFKERASHMVGAIAGGYQFSSSIDVVTANWAVEFAADVMGLNLLMDMYRSDGIRLKTYQGCEFFLIVAGLLSLYRAYRTNDAVFSDTHPDGVLRLSVLRDVVRGSPKSIFKFGEICETVTKGWLDEIVEKNM